MEDFAVLLKTCRMKKNVDSCGVKSKFYHIFLKKWGGGII